MLGLLSVELWGAAIAMALSLQDTGACGGAGRTYRCQPGSVNEGLKERKVQISAHGYGLAWCRHLLLTKKHGFVLKDSGWQEGGRELNQHSFPNSHCPTVQSKYHPSCLSPPRTYSGIFVTQT